DGAVHRRTAAARVPAHGEPADRDAVARIPRPSAPALSVRLDASASGGAARREAMALPSVMLRQRHQGERAVMSNRWMTLAAIAALTVAPAATAQPLTPDALASPVDAKVQAWRRDIHQHPELSNREFRTAEKVAAHLRALGLEPETGVAHT